MDEPKKRKWLEPEELSKNVFKAGILESSHLKLLARATPSTATRLGGQDSTEKLNEKASILHDLMREFKAEPHDLGSHHADMLRAQSQRQDQRRGGPGVTGKRSIPQPKIGDSGRTADGTRWTLERLPNDEHDNFGFIFANGHATDNPDDVTRRGESRSATTEETLRMLNTNKAFDAIRIEKADDCSRTRRHSPSKRFTTGSRVSQ